MATECPERQKLRILWSQFKSGNYLFQDLVNPVIEGGYGKGWREPLEKGRLNRFMQKMREPATKDDFAIGHVAMVAIVTGLLISFAIL